MKNGAHAHEKEILSSLLLGGKEKEEEEEIVNGSDRIEVIG